MKANKLVVVFLFTFLTAFSIPWKTDFATSAIPGFHFSITTPLLYSAIAITIVLGLISVSYLIFSTSKIRWKFTLLQFAVSIPPLFLLRKPLWLYKWNFLSPMDALFPNNALVIGFDCLFFLVQIMFFATLFKQLKIN